MYPILCEDKYGVMQIKTARQLIKFRPGIKAALNKTEYFMNQLRELYPKIAEKSLLCLNIQKQKKKCYLILNMV